MPELPEVETIRRVLLPYLKNAVIESARVADAARGGVAGIGHADAQRKGGPLHGGGRLPRAEGEFPFPAEGKEGIAHEARARVSLFVTGGVFHGLSSPIERCAFIP